MRRIGLVGASGAVGRSVLLHLRLAEAGNLRLGGRRLDALQDLARSDDEIVALDLTDGEALGRFCADCAVVVNAAGPTTLVMDRIARAAIVAGADYVDAAGDELVHERLSDVAHGDRRLLLSAGMMPGLTALLPRHLAAGLDGPLRLCCFIGGLDRFTPTAAGDYAASLGNGYGTPLAAWRGRVAARALAVRQDEEVPYFPVRVSAVPYLSQENVRIARRLGLAAGDWYNVFAGQHVREAFGRVQAQLGTAAQADAVTTLCEAAALDLVGHEPYQLLVYRLEAGSVSRSLMLRATDSYALSGAMAAFAALDLCNGSISRGLHFAGEIMEPGPTVDRLRRSKAVTAFEIIDGVPVEEAAFEDGAL